MPRLGPTLVRRLVEHAGSAVGALLLSSDALLRVPGIGERTARSLANRVPGAQTESQLRAATRVAADLVTLWDDDYPELLRQTAVPPVFLWCRGSRPWLEYPCLAVVGTRTPTNYGRWAAASFVSELANTFCIVSGLAIGTDSIVHRACLNAGMPTVAVFGSGLDRVYPGRNRRLAESIVNNGVLVSEFMMGAKPEAGNFPRRNRIISGLSAGVLVVEARPTGGALVTARRALDQNREVFVVPGRVDSPASAGCNALIHRGEALLVRSPEDVLEATGIVKSEPARTSRAVLSGDDRKIWEALGSDVKHVDVLCVQTGLSVEKVLPVLLRWELEGSVFKLPGGRYRRCRPPSTQE